MITSPGLRASAFKLFVFLFLLCGESLAQLPQARLDEVFPLGGRAGSTFDLEIKGKDLDEVKSLHFDRPGFRAEWVRPNWFRVSIAADVPPGAYDVRAVGKYGISGGRLFAVSRSLTEVVEKEPNDTPERAQAVPLNAAVNGRCDGNGDDYYRFLARKGTRVIIDGQAFRLDSTLRAVLEVSTASGKPLARSKPYFDRTDPLIDFVVEHDGEHVVRLHDATFSGGLPYRLVISDRPQVENAFPCAVVPGETAELTILGRNLSGGKLAPGSEATAGGPPLERLSLPFTAPSDPGSTLAFSFIQPLPAPSINARGFQAWPPGLDDALSPFTLLAAPDPLTLEREPDDSAKAAQSIALPTVVCGRLDQPGDADWYTFKAKAGESLAVDLYCERLDLPGDLRVIVTNDKGNEVAVIDDHGINFNALALHNRDPQGTFQAPADGTYRLLVQDTYGSGGPRYLYALRVGKARPDISPVVFHETPIDPSCPVVRQGGSTFLELCLNRRDGFNGAVTIEAEGLPAGVSCPPAHVSPQTEFADVVFTAAPDAPEWSGAVRLKAWATIDGQRVERPVRCAQRRWAIGNINTSRACREIALAVRSKAPYGLKAPREPLTVTAGGTIETKISVERYWPEFKGKVQLNSLNFPPGFSVNTTDLPEGKTETPLKINVGAGVPPGTYTLVLRGDAQVPFSPDPKAANKPNVRVADPATPLTVNVQAPTKK